MPSLNKEVFWSPIGSIIIFKDSIKLYPFKNIGLENIEILKNFKYSFWEGSYTIDKKFFSELETFKIVDSKSRNIIIDKILRKTNNTTKNTLKENGIRFNILDCALDRNIDYTIMGISFAETSYNKLLIKSNYRDFLLTLWTFFEIYENAREECSSIDYSFNLDIKRGSSIFEIIEEYSKISIDTIEINIEFKCDYKITNLISYPELHGIDDVSIIKFNF